MKTAMCSLFMICILFISTADALDDWTQQYPSPHPSVLMQHAMAYISGDQVLLFGGENLGGQSDETWVYDLSADTWIQKTPSSKPSARSYHAMAYIGGDQVLLFGGITLGGDETWVYDLSDNNWTQQSPSSKPLGRRYHAMAYIGGDQVLLFGGTIWPGDYINDETWVYDLSENTWTQQSPSSKPSERTAHAMAYIGGDQVLLFGGYYPPSNYDETWVYDLSANNWTQQSPSSKPLGRRFHAMAYIGGDQVLLFGGDDGGYDDETWVYNLSDDNWTKDANTTQPSGRYGHGLSETSMDGSSFLVLFGGYGGYYDDETWTFGGGDYPLPVELASFTATGGQGFIALSWVTASEVNCHRWEVHRSDMEDGEYAKIGALSGHGSTETAHTYQWVDRQVSPEVIYYYKLKQVDFDGSATWSNVVSAASSSAMPTAYALHQNYPNPFNPATEISYSIPRDEHVTLKVYNVLGAEVATLVDKHQEASFYTISWNAGDLASGVYFCRLQAGDFEKTIKMVLLK